MKRWACLAIMAALLSQAGCGDGVALTRSQRMQSYKRGLDMSWKMMADDFDSFMLNDRPSRLSRFRVE